MVAMCSSFTAVAAVLFVVVAGNTWTQLSPSNPIPGIGRSAMIWDEVGEGAFLFGGEAMPSYTKTNALYFYSKSLNAWAVKSSTGAPPARHMHTVVLRTPQRILYVFAGGIRDIHSSATGQLFSDLFGYNVATDSWTQLTSHTTPRALHTAVWDTASDRMIVYGGEADDASKTKLGDVVEYDPSSDTWSSPSVGTEPNARSGHVAVWDGTSEVMLMCCGHGDVSVYNPFVSSSEQHYNDLWSYSDSSGWTELVQFGSFTPRRELAAVWDANTRSLLGYGGRFTTGELDSMFYYFSTTDSFDQETLAGPTARDAHSATWNPYPYINYNDFHHFNNEFHDFQLFNSHCHGFQQHHADKKQFFRH
ncbi:gefF, partial [Symbiodinium sp. CCMP2456]